MKKIIMAAVIVAGFGTAGMAQTTAKNNAVKPVPKMTVAKKTASTHVVQSVTPTPKPVSTAKTTSTPIGKKAKAKKHLRKTNKAAVKSNKAAAHRAKKVQKKQ